ncbi:MAG TPA: ketoacyl-ACP synthase III [Melioribacteraceae bacterium]|nr:ketoacyl-ACP synthase III [Melioribacteraceae bacterium]
MRNSIIIGSGSYAPDRVLPNSYFNELLGEDVDTWLQTNLTIKERRWCTQDQSTADLCVEAANKALKNAGINAADLNLIIISTDTPEYISPSTASVVQHRLGALNAGTFDLNTACAGFVTALDTANKFIRADENYNYILVIGAYAMSKYLDLSDKKTVTLFADGAGAVVLKSIESADRGQLTSKLHTEGQYADWMGIYAGGTHMPVNHNVVDAKDHLLKFVKKFPKEINPTTWTKMIKESCEKINISPNDITHFFFTQININTIWETMENLGVDRNRAHTIMDRYGYTGSACIPMAFDDAMQKNKLNEGEIVCFMGSGGGLAFANAIYKL